jgi:hypothetical protein
VTGESVEGEDWRALTVTATLKGWIWRACYRRTAARSDLVSSSSYRRQMRRGAALAVVLATVARGEL